MKTALIIATALALSSNAFAQSKTPSSPGKDEKVDISDIENKYWAPKDTDFNVVQNRTYTKERRFSLTGMYGLLANDGYSEGNTAAVGINYFFSERYGLQLDYETSNYKDKDVVTGFKNFATGGSPDYNRVTGYYGVGFNIVPFYAKMSFMGKKIIYFDMSITPTLGMTTYESQFKTLPAKEDSSLTYGFDITQWFFLHKNFAIRFDVRQRWFKEAIYKFYGSTAPVTGTKLRDSNQDNTLLLLGATFFF